jgi:hypothetical protein
MPPEFAEIPWTDQPNNRFKIMTEEYHPKKVRSLSSTRTQFTSDRRLVIAKLRVLQGIK